MTPRCAPRFIGPSDPTYVETHATYLAQDLVDVRQSSRWERANDEFIQIMKHSKFSIVDQLNKTPARMSILSLVLSYEPNHYVLQKALDEAYM